MTKKYELAFCERFKPQIHGLDENSSPNIKEHFLIYATIDLNEFLSDEFPREEKRLRCYNIRLEIIQADELSGGQEQVCYLKTFWLRIVQRRWKKVFRERKEMRARRSNIKALLEKQRTGKWPIGMRNYPEFKL